MIPDVSENTCVVPVPVSHTSLSSTVNTPRVGNLTEVSLVRTIADLEYAAERSAMLRIGSPPVFR